MSEIACRKCKECGLISDVTQTTCVCGAELSSLPHIVVDLDELPPEQIGVINEEAQYAGKEQNNKEIVPGSRRSPGAAILLFKSEDVTFRVPASL